MWTGQSTHQSSGAQPTRRARLVPRRAAKVGVTGTAATRSRMRSTESASGRMPDTTRPQTDDAAAAPPKAARTFRTVRDFAETSEGNFVTAEVPASGSATAESG